jgi:hypothetical protein
VREVAWEDVPRVLSAVDADEARRIRFVEVLVPHESLTRVNIVDTPGLNSILPEHEETSRRFLAQADAIVWLFTVGQAGKATEREALKRIRDEGKRVLGVLNKIDQASAEEVETIVGHVTSELGDLVEALVPVSARLALAARKSMSQAAAIDAHDIAHPPPPPPGEGAAAKLDKSRWPILDAALEERFFKQARALKRDHVSRRLGAVLAAARSRAAARAEAARSHAEELAQGAAAARGDAVLFTRHTVVEEAKELGERVASTYRAAAREVLELVRPRKIPFGSHSATGPDRDFLLGFLDRELAAAIDPTHRRAAEELRRSAHDATACAAASREVVSDVDLAREADDALALVDARVFARASAFLRGYLRGGRVDEFFARVLPKLSLDEDNVYHSLVRDAPDLDAELMAPLAREGEAALRSLASRLDRLSSLADLARVEVEDAFLWAIDSCEDARQRLTRSSES